MYDFIYNYIWSIPSFIVLFLFFVAWMDNNIGLKDELKLASVGAIFWPITILFIIYARFVDGRKNVKNKSESGIVGKQSEVGSDSL